DGLLGHAERGEAPRGAFLLGAAQDVRPGEVLGERADPAESGLDGVRLGRDVVAVERVADLEAERVARTEAAGSDVLRKQRVPYRGSVGGIAEELDAGLARVAGARDAAVAAGDARPPPAERPHGRGAADGAVRLELLVHHVREHLERARALEG